jgi:U3 small nucleolar RNA-associated protein 15
VLRTFQGHTEAVHVTRFADDDASIFSCSDDRSIKRWDMVSQKVVQTWSDAHSDHIRCGIFNPSNSNVWITGGYDHQVKCWDVRLDGTGVSPTPTMSMDHGAPVEAVLALPGGGMLVTAGGKELRVWDMLRGGRLVRTVSNHQKAITSLCLDSSSSRLLSGGLDQQVKVYDLQTFDVTHSFKYESPVTSMALSPDNTVLAVGMANGMLNCRKRVVNAGGDAGDGGGKKKNARLRAGTKKYFLRGQSYDGPDGGDAGPDYAVEVVRAKRLQPYDRLLRKFRYRDALDAVLAVKQGGDVVVVSLIYELVLRGGLRTALGGRDDLSLEPLLAFVCKHITNPRYAAPLADVASLLFDLYGAVLGQSPVVDQMFVRLRRALTAELKLQRQLSALQGQVTLLAAAINASAAPTAIAPAPALISADATGPAKKKRRKLGGGE